LAKIPFLEGAIEGPKAPNNVWRCEVQRGRSTKDVPLPVCGSRGMLPENL